MVDLGGSEAPGAARWWQGWPGCWPGTTPAAAGGFRRSKEHGHRQHGQELLEGREKGRDPSEPVLQVAYERIFLEEIIFLLSGTPKKNTCDSNVGPLV